MNAPATISLAIDGMTCASCVGRVERALRKVPGVLSADVNLATERATVSLPKGSVAVPALLKAIEDAGYTAHDMSAPNATETAPLREGWRVVLAAALSAPLVLPMLLAPLGVPLMLPGWLQLLLATPVQFGLGARFYRSGWKALRSGSGTMDLLVAIGTSAAYGLSLAMLLRAGAHGAHLYFESSAAVITLSKRAGCRSMRASSDSPSKAP